MLETEVRWVVEVAEDISEAINAAFTSGVNVFQASKMDEGSKGDGKEAESSLWTVGETNVSSG